MNDLCAALQLTSADYLFPRIGYSLFNYLEKHANIVKAKIIPWETGRDLLFAFVQLIESGVISSINGEQDLSALQVSDSLLNQRMSWKELNEEEIETIRSFWDCRAKVYEDEVINQWGYGAPLLCVHLLLSHLKKHVLNFEYSKFTFLDAACGTGLVGDYFKSSLSFYFTESEYEMDALDISPDMLEKCKEKNCYSKFYCLPLGSNDSYLVQLPNRNYNGVFCIGTFAIGGPSPSLTIPEFVRLTAPGGFICFTIQLEYLLTETNIALLDQLLASLQTGLIPGKTCQVVYLSDYLQYLPSSEPSSFYRIWILQVSQW